MHLLRANILLKAKMEQIQLLSIAKMCALTSSLRAAGRGKEEEKRRKGREEDRSAGIYQEGKETSNSNYDTSEENVQEL